MIKKIHQTLHLPIIIIIIFILNFPIASGVTDFIKDLPLAYSSIWTILPIIYTLSVYLKHKQDREFHLILPIIFGCIIGYLVYIFTIAILSNKDISYLLITENGFKYFSLGFLAPICIPLYSVLRTIAKENWRDQTFNLAILLITLCLIFIYILSDLFVFNPSALYSTALASFILGALLSIAIGLFSFVFIRPSLNIFIQITHYFIVMKKPVVAFFIGYVFITVFFSGLYHLLIRFDPKAFSHAQDINILDTFIYSYQTITLLVASNIQPLSPLAVQLSLLENFVGIVWVTVVLAATIGFLQKPFADLSKKISTKELL